LHQFNVVNMRVVANCCMWNYNATYTSNMAACYDNDINDVTVSYAYGMTVCIQP